MKDHVLTFSANLPNYNEPTYSGVEQKTTKSATSNRTHTITSATSSPAGKNFVSCVRAFFHKPSKLVNAVRTFSLRSFIGKIRQVFSSSNTPQHVNETPVTHFVQKQAHACQSLGAGCQQFSKSSSHYFDTPQQTVQSANTHEIEIKSLKRVDDDSDRYISSAGFVYSRTAIHKIADYYWYTYHKAHTTDDIARRLDEEVLRYNSGADWDSLELPFHGVPVKVTHANQRANNNHSPYTPPPTSHYPRTPERLPSRSPWDTPPSQNRPRSPSNDAPPPPPAPGSPKPGGANNATPVAGTRDVGHKVVNRLLNTLKTSIEERITSLKRWNSQDKIDFINAFATSDEQVRQAMLEGMQRMLTFVADDLSLKNFAPFTPEDKKAHASAAAFVNPDDKEHIIHFRDDFFTSPLKIDQGDYQKNNYAHGHGGDLSQTWLLAHEISHFSDILGTDDINYDNRKNAADFADLPGLAALTSLGKFNADNVAYYLEFSKMARQLNEDHSLKMYDLKNLGKASAATPALDEFAVNFTEQAKKGELEFITGRNTELKQIIEILSRGGSPILLGPPGTGKTSLIKDLALRIEQGKLSGEFKEAFKGAEIRSLDMQKLTGGKDKDGNDAMYVGVIKGRVDRVLTELKKAKEQGRKIFLFIDEFHKVKGAGNSMNSPSSDVANMLKEYLGDATGRTNLIQLIGATTTEEFQTYIQKQDGALASRFEQVQIKEPTPEENKAMMRNTAKKYAHKVQVTESAIEASVRYAEQYDPQGSDPRRSTGLLVNAINKVVRLVEGRPPAAIQSLEGTIEDIKMDIKNFHKKGASADSLARIEQQKKLLEEKKEELTKLQANWVGQKKIAQQFKAETDAKVHEELRVALRNAHETQGVLAAIEVDEEAVTSVLREKNGIVMGRLTATEAKSLETLEADIKKHIQGQDNAIKATVGPIKGVFTLPDKNQRGPLVKLTLAGPPGTGKTETANRIATLLNKKFIPLSMGNYGTSESLLELTGMLGKPSPLAEVLSHPGSIILLDELNQAHPDVRSFFYDILDTGVKKIGGQTFNFKNTIIMMTTNIGQEIIIDQTAKKTPWAKLAKEIQPAFERKFEKAFISRMGKTISFVPLNDAAVGNIVKQSIDRFIADQTLAITFSGSAKTHLNNQFIEGREKGARAIEDLLKDVKGVISDKMSYLTKKGKSLKNYTFMVRYPEGSDDFTVEVTEIKK